MSGEPGCADAAMGCLIAWDCWAASPPRLRRPPIVPAIPMPSAPREPWWSIRREHPRIGTMQYPETLPLRDHEVVLSFDDGPLPRNSDQILDILASQCVKANFFVIGQMARAYPEGVRKLRDAGHTIGTHSQNHPLTMNKMPIERARQEIDEGIASAKAALGDDAAALGPFFRIPGLLRAEAVEDYLASLGIQVWSADSSTSSGFSRSITRCTAWAMLW